ncbi:MAG TPA: aminomethyl-transferring glycine dehydrogenase subunit GcvPA [Actinomycetota bacterium]|jgi:glycine dehydrogenase subunit 1|nr:aminomethyl-transferring glycine dehydrogenase subunit GcvPA [Actinomycetota bacterium]
MKFAPHTDDDVREMLGAIGLDSLDDLFDQIPPGVRLDRPLDLPEGISEMELLADMRGLAARNRHADDLVCFAGAGAYDHYVPAVVWALAGRSEFYTSYTPYQPELSQGVLQALFEYQSMICELTELEVSNASLYDGATALAEAVNLARSSPARGRVLVSAGVDRRYVETLRTYGRGAGYEPEIFDVVDGRGGTPDVADDVACVIVQHPNAYGLLEPVRDLFGAAHAGGARAIEIFDPMSLGVLAPPGEVRADIAVAEGQSLGNHLNYGGPYLGIIATRLDDVRRLPGRIVGETVDVDGRTGYVLTLQAREQHIRREKATSNICTNQTLMAIAATVYLAWLGPQGLVELGERCAAKARYAADRLCDVSGVDPLFGDAPFFKEFALRLPRPAAGVVDALVDRGFLGGVPLPAADGHALLVAVTERRTREEIDAFALALKEVLS